MVFIYRCFIAGLCDFTITFYLYIFLSMDFLSEINYMYVCMYYSSYMAAVVVKGLSKVISGLFNNMLFISRFPGYCSRCNRSS